MSIPGIRTIPNSICSPVAASKGRHATNAKSANIARLQQALNVTAELEALSPDRLCRASLKMNVMGYKSVPASITIPSGATIRKDIMFAVIVAATNAVARNIAIRLSARLFSLFALVFCTCAFLGFCAHNPPPIYHYNIYNQKSRQPLRPATFSGHKRRARSESLERKE